VNEGRSGVSTDCAASISYLDCLGHRCPAPILLTFKLAEVGDGQGERPVIEKA